MKARIPSLGRGRASKLADLPPVDGAPGNSGATWQVTTPRGGRSLSPDLRDLRTELEGLKSSGWGLGLPTVITVVALDTDSDESIEERVAAEDARALAEAGVESWPVGSEPVTVIIRKCAPRPGDPEPVQRSADIDDAFTAPPEPAHDARIAPPAHADEPRRPEPREMLSAFQEHASEAAEASPGVPWHVCAFSHLTGRCTIYRDCGRMSPMWLERERLDREEEARRDQALASTEPSVDGPDVLQLGGSEAAVAGPVLPPLGGA